MRRRRQNNLIFVILGLGGVVILLLAIVLVLVLDVFGTRDVAENAVMDVIALEEAAAPDPYAGLEMQAIQQAQAAVVTLADGTTQTLAQRVASGVLAENIELLELLELEEGQWIGYRSGYSVYSVEYSYEAEGVQIGPRWIVQMNPAGQQVEGSGGVHAWNGLATFLMAPDPSEVERFMNKSDEVIEALTNHRFENGLRLGAALLIYFLGQGTSSDDSRIIGWTVVPDEIIPDEVMRYDAHFQWEQGGAIQVASWEINLQNSEFRPSNMLADAILRASEQVNADTLMSILPNSIDDPDADPTTEDRPPMRAFRYVLANSRLREAVSALLTFRGRQAELEYVSWGVDPVEESENWRIEYRYTEDGEESAVGWEVNPTNGELEPLNPISEMAARVLSIRRGSVGDADEAAAEGSGAAPGSGDVPEGSGSGAAPEAGSGETPPAEGSGDGTK